MLEVNTLEKRSIKKIITKKFKPAKKKSKKGKVFVSALDVKSLEKSNKLLLSVKGCNCVLDKNKSVALFFTSITFKPKAKDMSEPIKLISKKSAVTEGKSKKLYTVDETAAVDIKSIVL